MKGTANYAKGREGRGIPEKGSKTRSKGNRPSWLLSLFAMLRVLRGLGIFALRPSLEPAILDWFTLAGTRRRASRGPASSQPAAGAREITPFPLWGGGCVDWRVGSEGCDDSPVARSFHSRVSGGRRGVWELGFAREDAVGGRAVGTRRRPGEAFHFAPARTARLWLGE